MFELVHGGGRIHRGGLMTQEELGALVAMLASGTVAPLAGQFLGFSCGWLQ